MKALVNMNRMTAALAAVRRAVAAGIGEDGQHVARGLMRLLQSEADKTRPVRAEELFGCILSGQTETGFGLLRYV